MNKAVKTALVILAVVFGFSVVAFLGLGGGNYRANDFLIVLGLASLIAGILALLISVILFITGPAQYDVAKGFLLSAGILFLAGFAACSSASINIH
ncbi:MAG: hypothetical protein JNM14_09540 [Ferruginibacter sp.]|nr:hypothetical protein [Ferruginibacter sp.]